MLVIDVTNIIVNLFLVHALRELKKLHSLSYRFILLMSISDICVGLSGIFSHTINIINIPKGIYYSDFQNYTAVISIFFVASTGRFTVIIALDRYVRMRYLARYEKIMTNKRAALLVSANILLGLVSALVFLGPFSRSFKDKFTFGRALFHMFGLKSICLLYILAYRSLKRTVDNLHKESNIRNDTKSVENANTVETNQAVDTTGKNDSIGNYPCGSKCSDVSDSCNVQFGHGNTYQPDYEGADSSNIHHAKHPHGYKRSNGQENGSCGDTANHVPLNDLRKKRSNSSVPGMDPIGTARIEKNLDMLVDNLRNAPSTDPCSTARAEVNNELRICINDMITDNDKENDNILSQGIVHEPKCRIPLKDPTIQITKAVENSFGSKKSFESRSAEQPQDTMGNKQGLEIINKPVKRKDVSGRGANNKAVPKTDRKRPDHEFAKAVFLINVAVLFCYVPGMIVYFALYPDSRSLTHIHAQTWCFLLNNLNSTLNAVIFISCSSELRLYVKSYFVACFNQLRNFRQRANATL